MAPAAVHFKPFARASLLLIGLAWTLPFLQPYHHIPLTAFFSEWLAFALGLAAAALLAARQSWREAELPVVALVPPALALLLVVQAALGSVPYPEQAVTANYYLLWASMLMLLGGVLVRELGLAVVVRTLAWFLLAGGLLSALAGLVQHCTSAPALDFLVTRKVTARVYGNLAQSNHFAAYVSMALCSAAYLCGAGRLRPVPAAACAALLLPALALSGSRSSWIYLAGLAALALLLFRTRPGPGNRMSLIFSLCLLPGFFIASLIAANWAGVMIGTTADQISSAQRLFGAAEGMEPRIQLAAEAWGLFLSAPMFGGGWGQFAWHHFTHSASAGAIAAPGVYNHAHNIVLHLLAETGILGALLVSGAALLWLADLRRIRFDPEWFWALALLGVLGVHSMLEYPLWYSYFLGMAAVLLGIGAQRKVRLRLAGFAQLTVTVLMLAGWFNLVSVLPYYRDFESLVFIPGARPAAQGDQQAFVEEIARLHREPLLAPYVELAVAYTVTVNEESLPDKLDLFARVMRFAPVSYVAYRQSLLLALAGEREKALQALERASRAYPGDLREFQSELAGLARDRPDAFAPLLELAASRLR